MTFSISTVAIWMAAVVLLAGFLLLGRVTVYPDGGVDHQMRVADVWSAMADDLPDVSQPIYLKIVYYAALALTLGGSMGALLIALAARGSASVEPESYETTGGREPTPSHAGDGG